MGLGFGLRFGFEFGLAITCKPGERRVVASSVPGLRGRGTGRGRGRGRIRG